MDFKKYVQESNAAFEAADPAGKRIMIAQDVIARLNAGNIVATRQQMVSNIDSVDDDQSFQEVINTQTECKVCGKGAILCAYVGRVNKFTVGQANNWQNYLKDASHLKLLELIGAEQLDLIETAFENTSYLGIIDLDECDRAQAFYKRYANSKERLLGIMENIIENKGEFKP